MFTPLGIRKVYRPRIFTVGWKFSPSLVKSGTFEEVKRHLGRKRRSQKGHTQSWGCTEAPGDGFLSPCLLGHVPHIIC